MSSPDNHVLSLVVDWMKKLNIRHDCAPFEAEWYCVCSERENVVDGIISKYGDCMTLCAQIVHFNANFNDGHFQVFHNDEDNDSDDNYMCIHDADK